MNTFFTSSIEEEHFETSLSNNVIPDASTKASFCSRFQVEGENIIDDSFNGERIMVLTIIINTYYIITL